jgi:hypothetical protein
MELTNLELQLEELEQVMAPLAGMNHNETFVAAPTELVLEELEVIIAP